MCRPNTIFTFLRCAFQFTSVWFSQTLSSSDYGVDNNSPPEVWIEFWYWCEASLLYPNIVEVCLFFSLIHFFCRTSRCSFSFLGEQWSHLLFRSINTISFLLVVWTDIIKVQGVTLGFFLFPTEVCFLCDFCRTPTPRASSSSSEFDQLVDILSTKQMRESINTFGNASVAITSFMHL